MTVLAQAPAGEEFVGLRRAAAIANRSPGTIQRLAILGTVRVLLERGRCPQFSVSDLRQLKGAGC